MSDEQPAPEERRKKRKRRDVPPAVVTPGRKPDWSLGALCKETEGRGYIGAAWSNDDGTISLRLNPGVVLDWHDNQRLELRLFPKDR